MVNTSSGAPPSAQSGGMVYDPVAHEYVLFGGVNNTGSALNDTWVFANGTWTDLTPSLTLAPSPRWYFAFVWDAADSYCLLFGGRNSFADLNDTWAFNGTAWRQLSPTASPPAMTSGRVAYDAADGYVWMYGGYTILGTTYNATWTYKAGTWSNITSSVTGAPPDPHPLEDASYDSAANEILLYGGGLSPALSCSGGSGVTWTYSGGVYRNITATVGPSPPVSFGSRMLADVPQLGGVALYGGWNGPGCGFDNQTWIFDAGSWYNVSPSWTPGGLWDAEMAGDAGGDSALLFGGNTVPYTTTQSDSTWNLSSPFQAAIRAGPLEGVIPFQVNVSAAPNCAGPFTYNWSWGDGSANGTTENASHTYDLAGAYLLGLTVTNVAGGRTTSHATIDVFDDLAVAPTVRPAEGEAPLAVHFAAGAAGGVPPLVYAWNFGDGQSSTAATLNHTYPSPGNYTWSLNVTDAQGRRATATASVLVAPVLAFDSVALNRTRGIAPLSVAFTATASGGFDPLTYSWSFGDGSSTAATNVTDHTYATVGTFNGSVTVRDAIGDVRVDSFTVTTAAPLSVQLSGPPSVALAPAAAQFSAAAQGGFPPYSYAWSLGIADATAAGPSVGFTYVSPGTYTVELTTTDSAGDQLTSATTFEVVAPLTVELGFTPTVPLAGSPTDLNLTAVGGAGPFAYAWSFGDGSTSAGSANESHTYAHAGSYRVSVSVRDRLGEVAVASAVVPVDEPLGVTLTTNQTTVTVGAAYTLDGTTAGGLAPFRVAWTGTPPGCATPADTLQLPCNATTAGTYLVTLWVNDSLGEHRQATTTVTIVSLVPISSSGSGAPPLGLWIGIGAGLAAIAVIVSVLLLRRRRGPVAPEATGTEKSSYPTVGADESVGDFTSSL
jgi:PKD repeat protein